MKLYFIVNGKKRKTVPIYVRLSHTRQLDLRVKSGQYVDADRWSNKTQTIKQRITTEADKKLIKNISGLRSHIEDAFNSYHGDLTKKWLTDVVYKFNNKKSADAKNLNDYIDRYIKDVEAGDRKNKMGFNLVPGTVNVLKGFQHVFNEYQGIYSEEQLKWHNDKDKREKKKRPLRPLKKLDFEDITIDFYKSFVSFLSDQGYKINTQGRFINGIKLFMKKSFDDKLHNNMDFMHSGFRGLSRDAFSVYLTKSELNKLYNIDLSGDRALDIARDAFLVLCETALRISDYKKVSVNIRKDESGTKLIYITQTKTKGEIVIPCSARLSAILKKYNGMLPKVIDQHLNRNIKIVARLCDINEVVRWETDKYGNTFETHAFKWQKISCHTGRRTACTNMFLAGIPTISIRQISGHKTETSFLKYIKVTPEENARKLALHPYFSGLKAI